jgi:hypothetical protein
MRRKNKAFHKFITWLCAQRHRADGVGDLGADIYAQKLQAFLCDGASFKECLAQLNNLSDCGGEAALAEYRRA